MRKTTLLVTIFIISLLLIASFARSQSNAIIELNDDYTWNWVNGSPTPQIITNTPGPTQTPWIVTATVKPILTFTPTEEIITLTPTNTPDPLCLLQNQANASIRVRDFPSTSGTTTIGWIENGEYIHPEAYFIGTDYTWYKIFWDETTYGWTANFYTYISGDCEGLLYENPFELLIVGLHVTGGSEGNITNFESSIQPQYNSGVAPYIGTNYCLNALSRGDWCAIRWPPDCPDRLFGDDPEASARQYMDARNFAVHNIWATSGYSDRLIVRLTNECPWDEDYSWWDRWMLEAVKYANDNNWPPLAMPGLGPGYGNYVMLTAWAESIQANYDRGGYFTSHNYAPVQWCGGDGSLSNGNEWCAYKHRMIYRIATEEVGVDIRILITESSPTDGYQPVTDATLRDIGRYTCNIQNDEGLAGIFYWNVGPHAQFADANLEPYLSQLSHSILTCGEDISGSFFVPIECNTQACLDAAREELVDQFVELFTALKEANK